MRLFLTEAASLLMRRHKTSLRRCAVGTLAAGVLAGCSGPVSQDHAGAQTGAERTAIKAAKEPDTKGTERHLRLITQAQYLNTLAYVFGPDVKPEARFPPPPRTDGLLVVGTGRGGVTDSQLELYQKAAVAVAALVVNPEHRKILVPCKPASDKAADKACATKFITETGRLLNRRPLNATETGELVDVAMTAADRFKDFYAGLGIVLESMLVSPNMLFVAETAEPNAVRPGRERLDAYSLASRWSYFLWNAAPDDAVLKAAETGELATDKGRARVIDMMLTSPRLAAGVQAFFDDMFGFDDFETLSKDPKVYPAFTGITVQDAREQTLRTLVDHLITKNRDYRDLYTTRATFLSPPLGALYHVAVLPGWSAYEFPPDSLRAGLLTQISFLAVHSHPGRSSATLRGKALRELLLCQPVPRPPANVDFSVLEDPKSALHTARDRLTLHRSNPVCAGCHKITDPMGLALENFDGSGRYRDTEQGVPIDASGSLDGVDFKDVVGLGQALHDHPSLPSCLVRRVFSYGTAGSVSSDAQPTLDYLNKRFKEQGYRLPALLRTIALSQAFSEIEETLDPAAPVKSAGVPATDTAATSLN